MKQLRDIFGYILGLVLFVGLMPTLMWLASGRPEFWSGVAAKDVVAWFLFFIIMFVQVLSEERRLHRDFGKEYDEYCKNVPRYIPRLTPWKPQS